MNISSQGAENCASQSQPAGVGLSLSGGGFRAALFHLGALRRLNELEVLKRLSIISSVSGGSILSAYLATRIRWPAITPVGGWEQSVAKPFRNFCRRNIRTGPILEGLLPGFTNSELLAKKYQKYLTSIDIVELPKEPAFVFCATDLGFGVNWIFAESCSGDYQAGYFDSTPKDWKLSLAVAASSCFPPIFKPISFGARAREMRPGNYPPGQTRDNFLRGLRLSDGGVYDNLGLKPIWDKCATVLCSDGGALFGFGSDQGLFWEVKRYVSIPENQCLALRKRWLMARFNARDLKGTYWGVGSSPSRYGVNGGYSKALAMEVISKIRTDLDAFSEAEAAVLENHGYTLADAAITTHLPSMLPNPKPPLNVPHQEWLDEAKIRKALRGSSKRKLIGRW